MAHARRLIVLILLWLSFLTSDICPQAAPAKLRHGVARESIDTRISPGDDFYRFANGRWLERTQIPPDRAFIGAGSRLADLANRRVAEIIEGAVRSDAPAGSTLRKIADLYRSYIDEGTIESKAPDILLAEMKRINAIRDKRELAHALGESLRSDVDPLNNTNFYTPNLFGFWRGPGFEDPRRYNAYLLQGGLELPDYQLYLSDAPSMREIRVKYQAHIATMLRLAGLDDPGPRAARVFELESAIATKHSSSAGSWDVRQANNPWKREDFATKAPGLEWPEFFKAAGLNKQAVITVWQPLGVAGEAALVASFSLQSWKDWLAYHFLEDYSDALPKAINDESFAFFGNTLNGVQQRRPQAQRAVDLVNRVLGDPVGEIYVQRYFLPEAQAQVQAIANDIVVSFRKRIMALTWMDASTKAEAIAKLDTLYVGIGAPGNWKDYSSLEIRSNDLYGNLRRAGLFTYHHDIQQLGAAVDRREWAITPQTVNALNLPLQNSLNFPAAFLAPPFFDPAASKAVNYGAIGSIIGHEISHSFDPVGSRFDSLGQLRNWWTPADSRHFEEASLKLAAQYDLYRPFPDLAVDGRKTLGENVADLAGVTVAFDAYMAAAGDNVVQEDGFSGEQQFFIAFGQNAASKLREPMLRQQIMSDVHAPDEYRADIVRNLDAWYSAFDVQPAAKLYLAPVDRVRIW